MSDQSQSNTGRDVSIDGALKPISVIVPVYNTARYITRCLESLFFQTLSDLEIILVDDASPDDAMEKVNGLLERCPGRMSITILRHEENRGLSVARNTGIAKASGKYLFFLDSDDWLPDYALDVLWMQAEKYDAQMCSGQFVYVGEAEERAPSLDDAFNVTHYASNEAIMKMFAKRDVNKIIACNKLILRTFVLENKLLFVEGLLHEDNIWSFSAALKGDSWISVDAVTYFYWNSNPDSITAVQSISDRLVHYFRVLGLMLKEARFPDQSAPEKQYLMAINLLGFTKTILWYIEKENGAPYRALYEQFRKHNVFHRKSPLYHHINSRYKLLSLGWNLPYPLIRLFSPYYLVKQKRRLMRRRIG